MTIPTATRTLGNHASLCAASSFVFALSVPAPALANAAVEPAQAANVGSSGSVEEAPRVAEAKSTETSVVPDSDDTVLTDQDTGVVDAAASEQLLKFYGFGDIGYRDFFVAKDSPWFQFLNRERSFAVGNLNLYMDAQLSNRWRALAEVRFTYLPHGAPDTTLSTPLATRRDDNVADYTDFSRNRAIGAIVLERATLEYSAFTFLTISAGHWLTPYGIWNVDHGSPVIIGVTAPFIIGAQLMPASQVGILAQGTAPLGDLLELGYAAGLSNGRADKVPFEDLDGNKAVTARFSVTYRGFGEATLGATFYGGRSTNGVNELYFVSGKPKSRLDVSEQFDELTYATDLKWVWGGLHVQTEWLMNDRRYTERGRPRGRNGGLVPDKRNIGGYGLVGYRTSLFGLMPYAKAEHSGEPLLQSLGLADRVTILTAGVNLRPDPRVVLKAEFSRGTFSGGGPNNFSDSPLQGLDMQAAWAF